MKELSELTSLYGHAWRQLKKGFEERIVEEVEEKEDKKKMTKVMTMKGKQFTLHILLTSPRSNLKNLALYRVMERTCRGTFRSFSASVCSCLSQLGDSTLVLKLQCKNIFNEMSKKLPIDNMHGLLRMIVSLATGPTKLSKKHISNLGNWLFVYLIEAVSSYIPEQTGMDFHSDQIQIFRCYVQPCIFLFSGSDRLLSHVLKLFDSSIMNDNLPGFEHVLKPFNRVRIICSILILMHDEVRFQASLYLWNAAIKCLLQNVLILLESDKYALLLEEKHVMQTLFDQLKSRACKLQCSDVSNLEIV